MGSSLSKSHHHRNYWSEETGQVTGASVARVAMSHGINANLVHRWRQLAREGRGAAAKFTAEFVAVSLPAMSPPTTVRDIQFELRLGATTMTISWPLSAAAVFGATQFRRPNDGDRRNPTLTFRSLDVSPGNSGQSFPGGRLAGGLMGCRGSHRLRSLQNHITIGPMATSPTR